MSNLMRWIAASGCVLWWALAAPAQSNGSISGRAETADGRAIRGFVILQAMPVVGSRTQPESPQRAFTDAKGGFQFSGLDAGKYSLCASPLPGQGRNRQEALVDGCEWGGVQTVTLGTRQALPP